MQADNAQSLNVKSGSVEPDHFLELQSDNVQYVKLQLVKPQTGELRLQVATRKNVTRQFSSRQRAISQATACQRVTKHPASYNPATYNPSTATCNLSLFTWHVMTFTRFQTRSAARNRRGMVARVYFRHFKRLMNSKTQQAARSADSTKNRI